MDFEISKDGVLEQYNGKGKEAVIPDSVTCIGKKAFAFCKGLTTVTIPEGVTCIGEDAFKDCHDLTSVTIPDSVTCIGEGAFSRCICLSSVNIPDSVTEIGSGAFHDTEWLEERVKENPLVAVNGILINGRTCTGEVTIPEGIKRIGCAAFQDCSSLTAVTIPDSVASIGEDAFCMCSSLSAVNIPASVTQIGRNAFGETEWLEDRRKESPLVVINGILMDGQACEGDVTIPDNVKSIGDCAFHDCTSLTSVTIGSSVACIGNYAFYGCSSLNSVTIGSSVTCIGEHAFENCRNLTSVTIPRSVTHIGNNAFSCCGNLSTITIPKSITDIGRGAFAGTEWMNLKKKKNALVILNGILIDGKSNKKTVVVPSSVTRIENWAFYRSEKLTAITIPESVTCIGDNAFFDCYRLTALHWVGRCNVTGITHKKECENKIGEALEMVESKDFSVQLDHGVKFPFVLGMFKETKDADALAYLKKNFAKLMKQYITDGDVENVTFFLEETELFTKKNIDKFLELAIAQEQHEIYTLLLHYKAEKLGFKDIEKQFKL